MHPDLQTTASASLRRALGGRLRAYRTSESQAPRLHRIRKAILRGELAVNGLNRWRLLGDQRAGVHWTFTDGGRTGAAVTTEAVIARREAGNISVAIADETNAQDMAHRIAGGLERPQLLLAKRDWSRVRATCPSFQELIQVAKQRGIAVHVIAAFGDDADIRDDLYEEARHVWRLQREPLLGPTPRTSTIERRFGDRLTVAGLDPVAQFPVAHYYLDFAVIGGNDGLPIRLDVEVDGRFWHEELPNRSGWRDQQRDRLLSLFGWRPVRFWTDEIETDVEGCVERVRRERVGGDEPADSD